MKIEPWPLGNLRDLDEMAEQYWLGHWSCLMPSGNGWWIRQDGAVCEYIGDGTWMDVLREYDKTNPRESS